MKRLGRVAILTVGLSNAGVLTVSAEDRAASVASVQVLAIRRAVEMPGRDWSGSVAYVSVGRRRDPSTALLKALADGTHTYKAHSACPRWQMSGFGEFCRPEAGAIEVFVSDVKVLDEDLAEATLGYRLAPSSGVACEHRFQRRAGRWSLVPEDEFRVQCRVS